MIIALIAAFCIVAITDAGGPRNESETPAFLHPRSLNGGGPLCPFSKGKQEFGYIPVGVLRKNKYFYAVMEAEDVDPSLAPTFWYLAGGPGTSSLGVAMTWNGPCMMSLNGKELLVNTYSWTKQANSIWIDAPGPTGFSTGPIEPTLEEFVGNMVTLSGQLFKKYPKLNRNVHLVGGSWSALAVAMLGDGILRNPQLKIDLKGVMMYSGIVGPLDIMKTGLRECIAAVDKCNSNGPGKPAKP
ncbi:conserved hypothetical protein, partial [Perkinsus marinus ATCC 50983]